MTHSKIDISKPQHGTFALHNPNAYLTQAATLPNPSYIIVQILLIHTHTIRVSLKGFVDRIEKTRRSQMGLLTAMTHDLPPTKVNRSRLRQTLVSFKVSSVGKKKLFYITCTI